VLLPGEAFEHRRGLSGGVRFSEDGIPVRDQGVAAEGEASGIGTALGLCSCEALGGLGRPLPGQEALVDIGGPDLEGEAELLEELPAAR
jgi:hypothetical protein